MKVEKAKGILCFCDGGFRPKDGMGSAACVVVVSACQGTDTISACDSDDSNIININYSDEFFPTVCITVPKNWPKVQFSHLHVRVLLMPN